MKRVPTTVVVAFTTHALAAILSALFWFRALRFRRGEVCDFGDALPAVTQLFYDTHFPAVILAGLVLSLTVALLLRNTSVGILISCASVALAAVGLGIGWWAMTLPLAG